jgi:formate hydrogenlyase regulatory protein HycA
MAVPEIVPIIHGPGYRTAAIGRYAQGQFLASATYAFPSGFSRGEGWEDQKRLYAVLHRFDPQGRHLPSDIRCSGTWAEQQRHPQGNDSVRVRAKARLAELLHGLPGPEYGHIAICPFQPSVDGVLFGLVAERRAEGGGEDDWAEPYPDRLGFFAPWDGTYDT